MLPLSGGASHCSSPVRWPVSRWTSESERLTLTVMKAVRLICTVRGHQWRRFRQEGADMRQCLRCGYLVRRDADPARPIKLG